MWLLNNQSEKLEEWNERDENLQYAILSHTWLRRSAGEGEEVSFADMADLAVAKQKAGWRKLEFAMKQAASDGLQHVWVDTCCINKESSAELAEAINSMFRIYQNSKFCYVYLDAYMPEVHDEAQGMTAISDINVTPAPASPSVHTSTLFQQEERVSKAGVGNNGLEPPLSPAHPRSTETGRELNDGSDLHDLAGVSNGKASEIEATPTCSITAFFQKCRWFKRGWTLQEMIASPHVVFFDASGDFIGALSTLVDKVSGITGVHREILTRERPRSSYSIAQRMAWAADRETTRVEDRAYSMLGIFDINLPIIYGEGERAFRRLQEELLRVYNDHTIFAWGHKTSKAKLWLEDSFMDSEDRMDLIASSPDAFGGNAYTKMTTVAAGGDQTQYEILGRTIRFHLPIHDLPQRKTFKPGRCYIAVLNCCFEDDPSSIVFLRLVCEASGHLTRVSAGICDVHEAALHCTRRSITLLREANDTEGGLIGQTWPSMARTRDLYVRSTNKSWVLSVISGHGRVVMNPEWTTNPALTTATDNNTWNEKAQMFSLPVTIPGSSLERERKNSMDTPFQHNGQLSLRSHDGTTVDVDVVIYPSYVPDTRQYVFDIPSCVWCHIDIKGARSRPLGNDVFLLRGGTVLVAKQYTVGFLSEQFTFLEFTASGGRSVLWFYLCEISFWASMAFGMLLIGPLWIIGSSWRMLLCAAIIVVSSVPLSIVVLADESKSEAQKTIAKILLGILNGFLGAAFTVLVVRRFRKWRNAKE